MFKRADMKWKISKETIIVGVPYLASGAQGKELQFAIDGWLKHFKEDNYLVVVIGDRIPARIVSDKVINLLVERVPGVDGEYRPALDIVNKMKVLHDAFPEQEGFVWSHDDIYAVNNFDLADIKFLKMLEPDLRFSTSDANPWKVMMARTRGVLEAQGLPTRNFALHLPCWYDWGKLSALIEKYDLSRHSFSIQSLYFNTYFPDRIPFQLNATDNIKFGLYGKTFSKEAFRRALRTKIWINNSVAGFSEEIFEELSQK